MSGFAFVLVSAHGRVVRTAHADCIADARLVLGCPAGCYVTSQASHALSMPRPLAATKCLSCGVREAVAGYERCEPCRKLHRTTQIGEAKITGAGRGNCAGSRRIVLDKPCHRCGTGERMAGYAICKACLNLRRSEDNARRSSSRVAAPTAATPKAAAPKTRSQSRHRDGYWAAYFADDARRERRNTARRESRGNARGASTRGVGQSSSRKRGGAA